MKPECLAEAIRSAFQAMLIRTPHIGVTNDIRRRAWEHRVGAVEGFTKRYGLARLIFAEYYEDIRVAIQQEKNMKHWPRIWKLRVIVPGKPELG